ncbi:putative protein-lysine deacylase ABHD14B isoform X2 [Bacillus rossius redtenbacheri]|uniref:putative protein-lysine deacylase ABHD14B isoform X2 n=1 Tax=Bacillus rossius redtenbacheri TaxID=93214 RepID=UPI002FDE7983
MKMASTPKTSFDWKKADLFAEPVPVGIDKVKELVEVKTATLKVQVPGQEGAWEVFYREARPPSGVMRTNVSVLLLHGRSFTSETWLKLGTLHVLPALGHRAVAVDLPGYGNTKVAFSGDKAAFLWQLCEQLQLQSSGLVVVSPSMSGQYSVGFLAAHWRSLAGYVAVAPVATDSVPSSVLALVQTPTVILRGQKDQTGLAEAAAGNLGVLPASVDVLFEGAGHACYLDQPDRFHRLLHNFVTLLLQQRN